MTLNELDRLALVRDLLQLSRPLADLVPQLASLDWDYDGEGVELARCHLRSVLQRYLRNELSSSDVESWANQVEGREDVRFEHDYEEDLRDVLNELANPVLTQLLGKH